jgi:hypothetical protein
MTEQPRYLLAGMLLVLGVLAIGVISVLYGLSLLAEGLIFFILKAFFGYIEEGFE